jgi:hypothetical protein
MQDPLTLASDAVDASDMDVDVDVDVDVTRVKSEPIPTQDRRIDSKSSDESTSSDE